MEFYTRDLRWSDVAPGERCFNEARARAIVDSFLKSEEFKNCQDRDEYGYYYLEGCIDQILVHEFGVWIGGWRSGINGGPVTSEIDSCDSPDQQLDTVISAIRQWLGFLQAIDRTIAEVPMDSTSLSLETVEKAAARLVPIVAEKTDAQDAWYSTCTLALNWFLEANGFGSRHSRAAVRRTFSGEFNSWTSPSLSAVEQATRKVREALSSVSPWPEGDALEHWLSIREPVSAQWQHFFMQEIPLLRCDGHRRFIENRERDEQMLVALEASRNWANGGDPLTLKEITRWQCLVLSRDSIELRVTDAYAKDGRELYGIQNLARFETHLDEANDESLTPQWRAALAYLDVCFFHPFDDGNARLARLVMDAILWRAGYALNYVEPVFVVSRTATDREGGTLLALAVDSALGRRKGTPRTKAWSPAS